MEPVRISLLALSSKCNEFKNMMVMHFEAKITKGKIKRNYIFWTKYYNPPKIDLKWATKSEIYAKRLFFSSYATGVAQDISGEKWPFL